MPEELIDALRELARARDALSDARDAESAAYREYVSAIRRARSQGFPVAVIAKLTGLSASRISQMMGRDGDRRDGASTRPVDDD